jgi:hypothetical protein
MGRMLPHAVEDRMKARIANMKCAFALKSIAPGYWRRSIRPGYRTDCATAFQKRSNPVSDGRSARLAGVICHSSREPPMTKLSKTLIAATAFAAIATSAFSQAPMEFKSGMAHVYVGGKMSGITIAPGEKNHEAMMKNATKVPNNTVFFMNNGQLYSTSGMLDPTGNFYIP